MSTDAAACEVLRLVRKHGWDEAGFDRALEDLRQKEMDSRSRSWHLLYLAWLGLGRQYDQTQQILQHLGEDEDFQGWSLLGRAIVARHQSKHEEFAQLTVDAQRQVHTAELLAGAINLYHASQLYYQDAVDDALHLLESAHQQASDSTFFRARILDALGNGYSYKNNYFAAREFYLESLRLKEQLLDYPGLAVTNGTLGRLYFDLGQYRRAETHFKEDLRLSLMLGDRFGKATMCNWIGRVEMELGHWEDAECYLAESVQLSRECGSTITEAFARKDLAVTLLNRGDLEGAERELSQSESEFKHDPVRFQEGRALVHRARGMLHRERARRLASDCQGSDIVRCDDAEFSQEFHDAKACFEMALQYFINTDQEAEIAKTQLEYAATIYDLAGDTRKAIVVDMLDAAIEHAEKARRDRLIKLAEARLRGIDQELWWRKVYERLSGLSPGDDFELFFEGRRESATIMFLDLEGSTRMRHSEDPSRVMGCANQMYAELSDTLRRHNATISGYAGDGFMAIFRGENHAHRAVTASLEAHKKLETAVNKPRQILGLEKLHSRVGLATGEVFLGNVGTYEKMEFTALGDTTNLAARLESCALREGTCISDETYQRVATEFAASSREVELKGLGKKTVWDIQSKE